MSIVACKIFDDRIEIGADSITVLGWTQTMDKFSKLETVNGMVIGGVGLAEENALLFNFASTHKPKTPTEDGVLNFIVEFAEWKKKLTEKFKLENEFIIVVDGKAFTTERFLIREIKDFYAIGAGMDYALTALYLGHSVKTSIEIACKLCVYCEEPIHIMEVKK